MKTKLMSAKMNLKKSIKKILLKTIPSRIKYAVLSENENYAHLSSGFAQITYSQQGEDLEISRILPDLKDGFYVDVGAFHPYIYSNTYKLYKRGWRGINIEPNPENIELFKRWRSKDININIGVSNKQAFLNYYGFNAPAINTFNNERAEEWSKIDGFYIKNVTKILTQPLSEILETYLPKNKKIDLLNIDAEGLDMEVLNSNNWSQFRPKIILIEDAHTNKASLQESRIFQFLIKQDYSILNVIGITLFFIDNSFELS